MHLSHSDKLQIRMIQITRTYECSLVIQITPVCTVYDLVYVCVYIICTNIVLVIATLFIAPSLSSPFSFALSSSPQLSL